MLLLDEPTSGLDAPLAEAIGRHVRELAAGGLAICLTSHDRAVVTGWADREVRLGATSRVDRSDGARRDGGAP